MPSYDHPIDLPDIENLTKAILSGKEVGFPPETPAVFIRGVEGGFKLRGADGRHIASYASPTVAFVTAFSIANSLGGVSDLPKTATPLRR